MVEYRRNTEGLKAAVREHSIEGYPIKVPIFGEALGIKTNTIRDLTAVLVKPVETFTFEQLSQKLDWDKEKHGVEHWVKYARSRNMPHADTEPLRWIYPTGRAILEDGYKLSEEDIRKQWLIASKSIDKDGVVQSYSFDIRQVSMHPNDIEPGMIIEFSDSSGGKEYGWTGRVIGVEPDPEDKSKIIYLETFEPVPALLAPKALAPWMIQPSFVPEKTWVIGYGTYEAMRRKNVDIPPGMFDPKDNEKRVYFLDQPIPLSVIENFCTEYYPKEPQCVWQSMVMVVLPLHPAVDNKGRHQGGTFRPFPDDTLRTEIEAQIDYYGGEMEFEE